MRSRGTPSWIRTLVRSASIVAAVATGPFLGGCGGDGDEADRLAAELIDETGGVLGTTQATCVAEGLVDSFGDDSFREVLDAAEGSGEDAADVRVEVIDIFASCDALDAVVLDEETGS